MSQCWPQRAWLTHTVVNNLISLSDYIKIKTNLWVLHRFFHRNAFFFQCCLFPPKTNKTLWDNALCETNLISQQNPSFKNYGTNLDGTKYKSAPENAENQNNIQLDTLKITYICFFFLNGQIINQQIMFLFDKFRTDSKLGESGLNHTIWSPRLVKLVKLVKVFGHSSRWTSSWTVKSLGKSWKTSKTILHSFSSSCNFIKTNKRTSTCGNSSRIPPPAQLLLHFSDFYLINFHSYIPGMKLRAQTMSSAWVCLLVSISYNIPII